MTLVCLAFLISLYSHLSALSFQPPLTPCFPPFHLSLPLPVFSLSVCLGVLSLIRAFGPSWRPTPLNSSMSALHLHCLFAATSAHCYWHCPAPERFILLTLTYLLLLAAFCATAASDMVVFPMSVLAFTSITSCKCEWNLQRLFTAQHGQILGVFKWQRAWKVILTFSYRTVKSELTKGHEKYKMQIINVIDKY